MSYKYNNYRYDSYKEKLILDEIRNISKEYHIGDSSFLMRIKSFYVNNPNVTLGNISKNMAFINYILSSLGYEKEDAVTFMVKNRNMIMTNYSDLRFRLSIFYHFGHFDEVFYKKFHLLSTDSYNLGTRDIFAIFSHNPNITLDELVRLKDNLSVNEKKELRLLHYLDRETILEFDSELLDFIKANRKENMINKLKSTK